MFDLLKVAPGWYFKTKGRCFFSKKIKVGFGPITSGEDNLAERKWRIDPIIDGINRSGGKYVAGFFFRPEEMGKFDIVVIVKKINPEFVAAMGNLRDTKFIYDMIDNPNDEPKYDFYWKYLPGFVEKVDGFILSSPVHLPWLKGKRVQLIEHPILNRVHKTEYRDGPEIQILAQGYFSNLLNLRWLEHLLPELSERVGKPIRLIYHSEIVLFDSEFVRYVKWSVGNCFEMMERADMAITIKDLFKPHQYTKPSTKVIAYMAAGLPVICKPTAADRLVIRDGVTGFFAYRQEDWVRWIVLLASRLAVRRQMGRAARKSVIERYSLNHILEKYLSVLDSVSHG